MNCPKCNSPINEGDKFCQVCGNVLNSTPQQPVVETPNIVEQPAQMPQQPMPQPMPQQPMYNQQPMMGQQPNMMNGVQQPKKNNTIVIILAAVIVILLVAVVVLFVTSGKDEGKDGGNTTGGVTENGTGNTGGGEPTPIKTTTTKKVNEYTFELPEGYDADVYQNMVMLYDDNHNFEASVENVSAVYRNVNKEQTKANLTAMGLTNVTYTATTKNGKNMLIYTADYQGYKTEVMYMEYTSTKLIASMIVYNSSVTSSMKDEIYKILTTLKIEDSGYSNTAGTILPNIDLAASLS